MSLLDEWIPSQAEKRIMPQTVLRVQENKYKARRFMFDDHAVITIASLIKDYPELLFDNYQFALPTYETMYIEYNLALFLDVVRGHGAQAYQDDHRVGYLIHKNSVVSLIQGDPEELHDLGRLVTSPIGFTLDGVIPNGFYPVLSGSEGEHANLVTSWILGTMMTEDDLPISSEIEQDMLQKFRPFVGQIYQKFLERGDDNYHNAVVSVLTDCAGEIRNFLALMLWLNQPKLVDIEPRPAFRKWIGSKQRAYAAHNVVSLKKHTTKQILRVFHERNPVRRHEVQAFWRNFNKTQCSHDWPIFPDEKGHWHCKNCEQWRTRVKQHERGDAGIGFVTKEYRVK